MSMLPEQMAATAKSISITIEKVENIAKSTLHTMEDTQTNTKGFRGHKIPDGAFSKVPLAEALARQEQAAHDVFVSTINGVIQDLQDFHDNLMQSAKAHGKTDEDVQAALLSLGSTYEHHTYHSTTNYDTSRQHAGKNLQGTETGPQSSGTQDTAGGSGGSTSSPGAGTSTDAPTKGSGDSGKGHF
ncbi:MAG: hypothetical protein ACRDYZ_01120 [Acidimicrobiales bacterium]